MSMLNITIQYNGKDYSLRISEDKTINNLISELCKQNSSLPEDSTAIKFGGCNVKTTLTLKQLGIKNGNVLQQVKKELNEIPGIVVSFEPDMITLESTQENRAKMPCGHVISRESMTDFLRNLIQQRIYLIECPGINSEGKVCRKVWDFGLCAKVGVLTKEERNEFENGFAKNLILVLLKAKSCPQCSNLVMKGDNISTDRVSCFKCKNDFCWICMKQWKGGVPKGCGNFGCGSPEEQIQILASCKLKDIGSKIKGVPEIRACPACKTMINHASDCKHMTCYNCKESFCFMCLSVKPKDKDWICGGPYDPCPTMAPKQTQL